MGYSGASGGHEAILAAEQLVERHRYGGPSDWLGIDQITDRLRLAVDRIMGEGGLWAPELAARALRQAEGDVQEAAQLIRAHRSTLPRVAYSEPVHADELRISRRISPAFRNPPGSQLLGRTLDYVGRLLDLMPEEQARARATEPAANGHGHGHGHRYGGAHGDAHEDAHGGAHEDAHGGAHDGAHGGGRGETRAEGDADGADPRRPPRLLRLLRSMDLLVERRTDGDPDPYDITRDPIRPGVPRSARLTAMARAETGALVHLWYSHTFQPGRHNHEFPGEVRHGALPVRVAHPLTGNPVTVAEVRVTEVETIDDLDRAEEDRTRLDLGYGMCFGHNERKAIAMAGLDLLVHRDGGRTGLEQEVLLTLDGIEASGFLEHLKLPHYVDFRSVLDRKRAVRKAGAR
ncbi:carbon-phosphorus lyase complex subunit PhnI [Nonomuraea sp. PA05]|uniref:carbon-phosphorus lyase complex subunit PhnI n=1 Tax=Nonomuraea sp. PA05 TaxID=2604466 RepID=UPI0011D81C7B|nr:carbon-phosphorus lyase complex subunit PhnI [Nonomuraea sp. PA05]TYB68784.1 carbon-phosphorus lyase complex subunit PhnI [Nonomuraea sp. PA05]